MDQAAAIEAVGIDAAVADTVRDHASDSGRRRGSHPHCRSLPQRLQMPLAAATGAGCKRENDAQH